MRSSRHFQENFLKNNEKLSYLFTFDALYEQCMILLDTWLTTWWWSYFTTMYCIFICFINPNMFYIIRYLCAFAFPVSLKANDNYTKNRIIVLVCDLNGYPTSRWGLQYWGRGDHWDGTLSFARNSWDLQHLFCTRDVFYWTWFCHSHGNTGIRVRCVSL